MPYEVHTSVYEGPFDLLLHLILREEVELWEVSLSAIVDAYLTELDAAMNGIEPGFRSGTEPALRSGTEPALRSGTEPAFDLDVATEFLLIAATLVELKARRLLPGLEDMELDEELLRFEERDLLLARLLECKTFKDAAGALEARIRRAERSVPRRAGPEEPYRFLEPDPLERVRPDALRAAALRVFTAVPPVTVDTEHIAPVRASVRDAVDTVLRLLPQSEPMSFRAVVAGVPSRLEFVVRFLAVLELYKQGVVDLVQFTNFGELRVRRLRPGEVALDAASLDDWNDTPVEHEQVHA